MYSSADDKEALHLALREIYVNSLDAITETKQAKGNISISINTQKRRVIVKDDGPGIPIKTREDGSYSLVAAYTMSHTGSHNDAREVNAIGTNGIGAALVCHSSSEFSVSSCDGRKTAIAEFFGSEEGAVLKEYKETDKKTPSGVTVSFIPDTEVYHDAWFDIEALEHEISEMMKFYPNCSLTLEVDGRSKTYFYPNGLREKDTCIYYESESLIMALNANGGGIKAYGNRLYLPQGGAFFTQAKTQLTKIVNDMSGLKLKGEQVQAVFGGYLAIFVSNPLFSNQSKTAISNKEVNSEITSALRSEMEKFVKTSTWNKIVKNLEAEAKAEAAAERAREKVLKAKKDFADKKINTMSEKFCDTDWKNRSECRLFLGEGTSATSPIRRVKWPQDATMELRGKVLNVEREGWDKVVENKELMMIAKAIGATITDNGFLLPEKNFRFGSIILAADDDSDGNHIISLLMAFFYHYFPQLVKRGALYIIKPALFRIIVKGENRWFGTEKEMKDWCRLNKVKATHVDRYKGRGSLDDNLLKPLLDPQKGEFYQITLTDAKKAVEAMKLMAEDVEARKDLISKDLDFSWEDI